MSNPPPYEEIKKGNAPYPVQGNPPYPPSNVTYPPYPPQSTAPQGDIGYNYQAGASPDQQNSPDTFENFTAFDDKTIRRAFIRKVYLIMTAQLLVTCAFISVFQFVEPVKLWVRANSWFYYISYATFIVTYIALVCCPSVRRKYPGNFICLSVFTFALSYLTATIASYYDTPGVLGAAGITAAVCLGITIFAIQTKIDFTMCSGLILVASLVLFFTGITCIIIYACIGPSKVVHGVYAGIAILVFSLYLVYDTQMIIGGRKYELSPEDYIEGALQLYLDIVNMFLIILSLFGTRN